MLIQTFEKSYQEKLDLINRFLQKFLPLESEKPSTIHESIRYSVLADGKRIRPILCLAAAEAVGGDPSSALGVACSLEIIHTYSLIHDDLPCMDNDDYRRGRLTNHKVYGENMAVLTGDALLTLAFEWIASSPKLAPQRKIDIIQYVAKAAGSMGLVGGQVEDLKSEGKDIDPEILQYIHTHKTAKLIQASVVSGVMSAGAPAEDIRSFEEFGLHLGLAFQITDDILDVLGSSEKMGKAVKKDVKHQKATYPSLFGIDISKKMAGHHIQQSLDAIKNLHFQTDFLQDICQLVIERQN